MAPRLLYQRATALVPVPRDGTLPATTTGGDLCLPARLVRPLSATSQRRVCAVAHTGASRVECAIARLDRSARSGEDFIDRDEFLVGESRVRERANRVLDLCRAARTDERR